MTKCLICGSFNPITIGHVYLIKSAARLYDKVYVVLMHNADKTVKVSFKDRLELMNLSLKGIKNVTVDSFNGMTVDYAKAHGIDVIIKGVRNAADFSYEAEQAQFNFQYGNIQTLFLPSAGEFGGISSSLVRELVTYEADISKYVSENCIDKIKMLYGIDKQIQTK